METCNFTLVIPSLDPDEHLPAAVGAAIEAGIDDIILVDDGSRPECRHWFTELAERPEVTLLTHEVNQGKGAALKTAFSWFLANRPDRTGVVTADSDGQHTVEDILACAAEMNEGEPAVVLGCRDFSQENVPPRSRIGNRLTSLVFRLLFGMRVSDTQTGLRAIPTRYIEPLMAAKGTRYEFETNMLLLMGSLEIPSREVTIQTIYLEQNQSSHFRPVRDSLRVYGLIIKYAASSLCSCGLDILLFFLFGLLLFPGSGQLDVFLSTVLARVLSASANFALNRSLVFESRGGMARTFRRYVCLAVPIMLASWLFVWMLSNVLSIQSSLLRTVIKVPVDTVLFLISFRVQRQWVFGDKSDSSGGEPMNSVAAEHPQQAKEGLRISTVVKRTVLVLFTVLFIAVFGLIVLLHTMVTGPSGTVRDSLVLSATQASATKWVPGLFIGQEAVDEIVARSHEVQEDVIPMSVHTAGKGDAEQTGDEVDEWADAIDGMILKYHTDTTFTAYILLVRDPSRVYVGTSSDYKNNEPGIRLFDIVKREGCVAAINGGEFIDDSSISNGEIPIGLTYALGECVWNDGTYRTFMGLDKDNVLHVYNSMTKAQADNLGIRDGVSFQNGNVLITNNGEEVTLHYAQGNLGRAQRTAIGQRADGTLILLVSDGRAASSIGATRNDIIDLLVDLGAVTAGMLDGGYSTTMYYEDYYTKYNISTDDLDEYQLQGMVNRFKFTAPRPIPTFFLVAPET